MALQRHSASKNRVIVFILGLRLVQEKLFVADAYYGIYSVNLISNDVTSLVSPRAITPNIGFANDLCVSNDNKIVYFTDVSSKYSMTTMISSFLEGKQCSKGTFKYHMTVFEPF